MNRTQHQVGNLTFELRERDSGWELEQVTPGPLVSCVARADAQRLLSQLRKLIPHRRPGPAPRAICPGCGRDVAVIRGELAWHGTREPAPGRDLELCRRTGEKVPAP